MHRCSLHQLNDLYDERSGAPTNVWPEDRAWFVYADWDLWATKVSGSPSLIDALRADTILETVTLRF